MRIIELPPIPRGKLKTAIMSCSKSSSNSSYIPLTRCKKLASNPVNQNESTTGPSINVPSLRDDEWSDEGSPNHPSYNDGNNKQIDSSANVYVEIVEAKTPNVKPS